MGIVGLLGLPDLLFNQPSERADGDSIEAILLDCIDPARLLDDPRFDCQQFTGRSDPQRLGCGDGDANDRLVIDRVRLKLNEGAGCLGGSDE
jgi:hypothetical protein